MFYERTELQLCVTETIELLDVELISDLLRIPTISYAISTVFLRLRSKTIGKPPLA